MLGRWRRPWTPPGAASPGTRSLARGSSARRSGVLRLAAGLPRGADRQQGVEFQAVAGASRLPVVGVVEADPGHADELALQGGQGSAGPEGLELEARLLEGEGAGGEGTGAVGVGDLRDDGVAGVGVGQGEVVVAVFLQPDQQDPAGDRVDLELLRVGTGAVRAAVAVSGVLVEGADGGSRWCQADAGEVRVAERLDRQSFDTAGERCRGGARRGGGCGGGALSGGDRPARLATGQDREERRRPGLGGCGA